MIKESSIEAKPLFRYLFLSSQGVFKRGVAPLLRFFSLPLDNGKGDGVT